MMNFENRNAEDAEINHRAAIEDGKNAEEQAEVSEIIALWLRG